MFNGLLTQHPLPDSPCIDAGSNSALLQFDQRGQSRVFNGQADIGAVESLDFSLVVTNTNDSGPGSLRQAVISANAMPGPDTVTFDSNVFAGTMTISLTSGEISIIDDVAIMGPTIQQVISANDLSRIFNTTAAPANANITIQNLRMESGKSAGAGGGILIGDESVTLESCYMVGMSAGTDGGAVAVTGAGSLLFEHSVIGITSAGRDGGCLFTGNQTKSVIIRESSTLHVGTAGRNGGGAAILAHDTFLLEDSIFYNNVAGNDGGGLWLGNTISASPNTIRNSTFVGNTASGNGGGILALSPTDGLLLQNSTITRNTASGSKGGGGVAGAGFSSYYGYYGTGVNAESCIISNNKSTANANDDLFTLAVVLAKFCAIGTAVGASGFVPDATTTALLGQDIKLLPTDDYGGGTTSVAPRNDSPVINQGSNPAGLIFDQRSLPRTVDGQTDIGAVEVQHENIVSITRDGPAATAANSVTWSVFFSRQMGGLIPANFQLTGPGAVGASIIDVSFIGTGAWQVTATTGADGLLELDMVDAQNLSAYLDNLTFTGEAYDVDKAPPTVTNLKINDGSAQRSRVTSLTVMFSETVTMPANPADAFALTNPNGAVLLNIDLSGSTPTQTIAKLTFSGPNTDFTSLKDGRYTLKVLSSEIIDLAGNPLDGDGDGTGGDDYQLIGTTTNGLFRQFGDNDGNGVVNASDFLAFRSAFGGNSIAFDFNNNGTVDAADFLAFRSRFGSSV